MRCNKFLTLWESTNWCLSVSWLVCQQDYTKNYLTDCYITWMEDGSSLILVWIATKGQIQGFLSLSSTLSLFFDILVNDWLMWWGVYRWTCGAMRTVLVVTCHGVWHWLVCTVLQRFPVAPLVSKEIFLITFQWRGQMILESFVLITHVISNSRYNCLFELLAVEIRFYFPHWNNSNWK